MSTFPATNSNEAVELIIDGGNQLHQIINEDATTEIQTESGPFPSVRKALADTFLFLDPIPWQQGSDEISFNQLRSFGSNIYWAPTATLSNPVPMGVTPDNDDNWKLAPLEINKVYIEEEIISSQDRLLNNKIYRGSNGNYVVDGDIIPEGVTHLQVIRQGKVSIVAMHPIYNGEITSITDSGAIVNLLPVVFTDYTSGSILFNSVQDMKQLKPNNLQVITSDTLDIQDCFCKTRSYHNNILIYNKVEDRGGADYILTTKDRARVILGDLTWEPDGIKDHLLSVGDGTMYVAVLLLDNYEYINAEKMGASPYVSASANDVAISVAISLAKTIVREQLTNIVKLGRGNYNISKPITLRPDQGTSQRLVGLHGQGLGRTSITKIGEDTTGIIGHDVDAVIVELPADGEDYAYFGSLDGFLISGSVDGKGYGIYSVRCPVSSRKNIQILRRLNNYYQDDCWMSKAERIWSLGAYDTGISILGGTSVTGSNLYSDRSKVKGFNLRGLQYSSLHCSCDRTAVGESSQGVAYDFELTKGVSGQFNVETSHGVEFKFVNSDGVVISGGRSFNSYPVSSPTSKILCNSSTVDFSGFDWTNSISNLTPTEKDNYNLVTRDSLSSLDFNSCVFSPDMDDRFPRQLDFKFTGNVESSTYFNRNGVVTHTLKLNRDMFKKLCYVGSSGRIKLEIGICSDNSVDLMYLPVEATGVFVPSLSTSAASPDNVMVWYQNNVEQTEYLEGFVQDSWLFVRPSNTGNNREYHFKIFTLPLF